MRELLGIQNGKKWGASRGSAVKLQSKHLFTLWDIKGKISKIYNKQAGNLAFYNIPVKY